MMFVVPDRRTSGSDCRRGKRVFAVLSWAGILPVRSACTVTRHYQAR